jgi:thiosulfate reductase cytochrome b subunit
MKQRLVLAATVVCMLAFCATLLLWISSIKFADSFSAACGPLAVCLDSEKGEMRLRLTAGWSGGVMGPTFQHGPSSTPLASIFRWQANTYRGFGYDSAMMVDGLNKVPTARRWHLVVAPHWAVLGALAVPLFYSVEVRRRNSARVRTRQTSDTANTPD